MNVAPVRCNVQARELGVEISCGEWRAFVNCLIIMLTTLHIFMDYDTAGLKRDRQPPLETTTTLNNVTSAHSVTQNNTTNLATHTHPHSHTRTRTTHTHTRTRTNSPQKETKQFFFPSKHKYNFLIN